MSKLIKQKKIFSFAVCFFSCSLQLIIAQTNNKAVLSSRWFHPRSLSDNESTVKVIKELKPNRIDWTYCEDPAKLAIYKDLNLKYSLSINPQIPDSGEYTTAKYRIINIFGKPYIASWMKRWSIKNPYWGCVNNPLFKKLFFDKTIKYVNLGAYAIFVDDPLFNYQLQKEKKNQYGCFCSYCLEGYKKYKTDLGEDPTINISDIANDIDIENITDQDLKILKSYQKFQEISVVNFLKSWKVSVKAIKPDLLFLTNNYKGTWNDIYKVFDGGIAEVQLSDLNISHLDSLYRTADSLKKKQLLTLGSMNTDAQYYLMAYCNLRDREYIIPWDLFAPDKLNSVSRYYGNIDEIKKLQTEFNNKSLQIEVSDKPFAKSAELSFYRIENRATYKSFVLNRTPISLAPFIRMRYKIAVAVVFVGIILTFFLIAKRRRKTKKAILKRQRHS